MIESEQMYDLYTTILRVRSVERSVEFYERIFDLKWEFRDLGYPLASLSTGGGMRLTFWEADADAPLPVMTPASGFVSFVTPDVAAAHAEITRRGAAVSPIDDSRIGVRFFWVTDPDGHSALVIQLLPD